MPLYTVFRKTGAYPKGRKGFIIYTPKLPKSDLAADAEHVANITGRYAFSSGGVGYSC